MTQLAEAVETTIRSRRYKTTEDYLLIDELRVDLTYHRTFDSALARRLLASANGEYVEEVGRYILVSKREDGYYVIAGLHRAQMARIAGHEYIPAVIVHNLAVAEEANLARLEGGRKKESPIDTFRQEYVAGHAEAVNIARIVEAHGAKVHMGPAASSGGAAQTFDAVGTLRHVYRLDDGKTLKMVLGLMREGWGKIHTQAPLMRGFADFLADRRHLKVGFDRGRMVGAMKRDGFRTHESSARDLKPKDAALRTGHFRAFVESYNWQRRKDRYPMPWR